MKKQFNQVDTLFITIQTLFRIVSNYNVKEMIETCGLLVHIYPIMNIYF